MTGWMLAAALALVSQVPAPGPGVPDTPPAEQASPPAQETPAAAPPATAEIMALPPALVQRVADQVVAPSRSHMQRLQRLMELMFGAGGLGIQYHYDATSTVEAAYLTRKANCLTFTMLFIALAREAGLDAYAQQISETLAWHQLDSTIYRTDHINAGIRIGASRYTVDVGSESVIARQPPKRVSDQRLLALFYNNRAAALMAQDALADAAGHMHVSLDLDPDNANSWSNRGVLLLREGDLPGARLAYQRALQLEPVHAVALFNMLTLVQRTGDATGEAEFRRRLERVQAGDPFHHVLLATDHERNGRHALAATHYQRAIHLHGGEHRFHFALARVHLRLGEQRLAQRALRRAQELGGEAWRDAYQQEFEGLANTAQ